MVPVTSVLRQLQTYVNPADPDHRHFAMLLDDFAAKRFYFYHPCPSSFPEPIRLAELEAKALFVAEVNHQTRTYGGSFLWFEKETVDQRDCLTFKRYMHEYSALPGWKLGVGKLDKLPMPSSATLGGLLICQQGDQTITLGIMPNELTPTVALVHLVLGLAQALSESPREGKSMKVVPHGMIESARQKLAALAESTRQVVLQATLTSLQRDELVLIGSTSDEVRVLSDPNNHLQISFLLSEIVSRANAQDPVRYFVAWEAIDKQQWTQTPLSDQVLMRFFRRRRALFDESVGIGTAGRPLPQGLIHAAMVVTRHPDDGLTTRFFRSRDIDDLLGVAYLQEAIEREFF